MEWTLKKIDARKLRDAGFAVLLAIPTVALTRPTATEAMSPVARHSPIVANAAIAEMTTAERRSALPTSR